MLFRRRKKNQYVSSSVLIDERAGIGVVRFATAFSVLVFTAFLVWAWVTPLYELAQAPGTILPVETVRVIQNEVSGTVKQLAVAEGQHVISGDFMLEFSAANIESDIETKRIQLTSSQERIKSLTEEYRTRSKLADMGIYPKLNLKETSRIIKDLTGRIDELKQSIDHLQSNVSHLKVVSPVNGTVFRLHAQHAGAFVRPGEVIMELIPDTEQMLAELRVSPSDIGHVKLGQKVRLSVMAYDEKKYGNINGTLIEISPTTVSSPEGIYYRGKVALDRSYVQGSRAETPLKPGMAVSGDIKTGSKTVLEYILKPIFNSTKHSFHER